MNTKITDALRKMRAAFYELELAGLTDEEWDMLAEKYPFSKSFEEITADVDAWCEAHGVKQ